MAKRFEESKEARELLERIYDVRRDTVNVSPSWLATEAMYTIDPTRSSHPLEYLLAHLQLRQLARALCAGRWEKPEEKSDQHELFPELQRRYPIEREETDEDPQYRLLEHLTDGDVAFNVTRLRTEAASKMRHADSLEAWGRTRPSAAA